MARPPRGREFVERPACPNPGVRRLEGGAGLPTAKIGKSRDHRGVVGRERGRRNVESDAVRLRRPGEIRTKPPVRAHASDEGDAPETKRPPGASGLRDEDVDHRLLESESEIGAFLPVHIRTRFEPAAHRGLEPAETQGVARSPKERAGQHRRARASRLGEAGDGRPPRVAESEELGNLVKGLSGRVVTGRAEDFVTPESADMDEETVPAGDDEGKEGTLGRKTARDVQEGRDEMPFDVMDAQEGLAPTVAKTVGEGRGGEKRPHEARSAGVGDERETLGPDPRLGEESLDEREERAGMIARREFRHHPSVGSVKSRLRAASFANEALLPAVEGHGRIVARRLYGKGVHKNLSRRRTAPPGGQTESVRRTTTTVGCRIHFPILLIPN